jgi:hypothetical protein
VRPATTDVRETVLRVVSSTTVSGDARRATESTKNLIFDLGYPAKTS